MNRFAGILVFAALPMLTACAQQAEVGGGSPTASAGACQSAADVIFACTLEGGAKVSVCRTGQSVQYHEQPAGGGAALTLAGGAWDWANVPYSGGGETQVRFADGGRDVVVYSRIVRTRFDGQGNEPEITDGVMVPRGDLALLHRLCDPEAELAPLDLNALEAIKSGEAELFGFVTHL